MVRWTIVILLLVFFLFGNYGFKDIALALGYYGEKIVPSSPRLGITIFIIGLIFIMLTDDIIRLFKHIKKYKK